MLRLNNKLKLSSNKCKIIFDHFTNNNNNLSPIISGSFSKLFYSCSNVFTGSSSINPTDQKNIGGSLVQFIQPNRNFGKYIVQDLSVLWYRRRAKALEQRLKVLNPSSPVIDKRTPLPPSNDGRYSQHLFEEEEVRDLVKDEGVKKDVVGEINRQIHDKEYGRLFAVINVKGKQFKVTPEDIVIIQGYWAPNIGDRLRLHKVMLVGGSDFTLLGRPILDNNLIRVEATVVEKTLSYTKLHFRLKKRKNFRRLKFFKDPYTMLRINMIELLKPISIPQEILVKEPETVEGSFNVSLNSAI